MFLSIILYGPRSEVERLFRRPEGYRRSFSRFEKLDVMFTALISLMDRGRVNHMLRALGISLCLHKLWDRYHNRLGSISRLQELS